MNKSWILLPLILLCWSCSVLGAGGMNPVQSEKRVVSASINPERKIVLNEPMVFLDQGPYIAPSRGIRLMSGSYSLEAEDSDYLYYLSATPIEYRVFNNGVVTDTRFMPGGIYFSKSSISLVPAGAYLTVDDTHKILTWKLGLEFIKYQGSKWTRVGQN
jgi:hypothetical protein